MKKIDYISYFSHAFVALVFMGAISACVQDEDYIDNVVNKTSLEGLAVFPTVSEAQVITRSESVEALKEKDLNTLDVFVEHVTNGTGDGKFMNQYHLPFDEGEGGIVPGAAVIEGLNWLADRWRVEGLQVGEKYNIYVAANNTLTHSVKNIDNESGANFFNVQALKDLTYGEVALGVAELDDDGNIKKNSGDATTGNIYKLYSSTVTGRAYTDSKEFMMDGVLKNWTPTPGSKTQTFEVDIKRAAAKIVLNVDFDEDFVKSLAFDKDDTGEYTIPKDAADKVEITGTPAWKFSNFAFGAPVFTPDTAPTAGEEVYNSGFNIFHNQSIEGGTSFTITTYSYPNVWTEQTDAPSLVISVGYKQNGETTYNYYRIPIVGKDIKKLERNYKYEINATIASRGSDTHEDVNTVEDIYYKVTSWNNEDNEDQESGDVTSVQHYYLQVNPKVYTLRGDGQQSVDIHFSRAKNTSVDYKLFTFPNISSAVDFSNNSSVSKTAVTSGGVLGWYFSDDKHMITVSDGVTITNNDPGAATAGNTEGSFTVTSTALQNRAIKYILMRVYLKDEHGNDKSGDGYYEDVLIRHFPTDNIQSAEGLWSSRTSSGWWSYSNGTSSYASGTKWDGNPNNNLRYVFSAKYFDNTVRSWNGNSWQNNSHLDNPYKYVIQISSTSEQYVMGRPALDNNGQSDDHVVSPAFMIASQLGATSSKSPANNQIATMAGYAANHCRTYKEVDVTGAGVEGETLWTNWRLPTREEVGVILKYQNAGYDTMEPVLTGRYYWTLEGAAVATGVNDQWADPITWYSDWETRYQNTANDYRYGTYRGTDTYGRPNQNVQESSFIRCIRDMSAEEIENLNKWNTIIAKYQAK